MFAMGVLLWWSSLGLKLACEKGSFGSEVVWIGTHLVVNSKANKVEVRLPAKKNVEILAAMSDLMDGPGAVIKHDEVRKVAGKESWVASFLPQLKLFVRQLWASLFKHSTGDKVNFVYKRQVWPALSWLRRFHEHQRGELVRHLFLVDQLLDGLVLEVDASTTGGGAACWHGDRRRSQREPPDAFVCTQWTPEDEQLLFAVRGDPAHQATWEAFMALLAIRHFVTLKSRGKFVLVGDDFGSMVQFGSDEGSKATKINEIAKELALHLAPLGHELVGIHVWSEENVLADALSRIGEEIQLAITRPGPKVCAMRAWKCCAPGGHQIGFV